jgi:hypothetical protein
VSFRGRVKHGVILLDEPARVPEGALVEVVVVSESPAKAPVIPTLAQRYAAVVGIVEGLPPDLATTHDLDIYGTARASDE